MADIGKQNIQMTMEALACRETAEYIVNNDELYKAAQIEGATEIIDWCLEKAPKTGMALEFGIGFGRTLKQIANSRFVHGFDSFKGLPEAWRSGLPKGTFSNAGMNKPTLYEKIVDGGKGMIHEGWFVDTIPKFIAEYADELEKGVSFIHIDSDLYSSAVTVLDAFKDYLRPRSVILFDEYWNYPGWSKEHVGEHAALMEWDVFGWEYVAYNPVGQEVAIRMKQVRNG